jgi:hypothetical protein
MHVQVDKARRYDEPARIDCVATCESISANGGDFAVADADVARGIKPRLRIHHAAINDYAIVSDRLRTCGRRYNA